MAFEYTSEEVIMSFTLEDSEGNVAFEQDIQPPWIDLAQDGVGTGRCRYEVSWLGFLSGHMTAIALILLLIAQCTNTYYVLPAYSPPELEDSDETKRLNNELLCEKLAKRRALDQCRKLAEENDRLKNQAEADKREIARLKEQIFSASNKLSRICERITSKLEQLQRVTMENEGLRTAYGREREAHKIALDLCRKLEEETAHLKNQIEAGKREIEKMKQQIASFSTEITNSYDMSREPRGVCVIINNIHFEDMAYRDGAEGDTDRLREVFESLGFTVVTFHDLGHSKMVDVMKEDQGKADHSNYDCFVCLIMSHGTMGKVYSSDDVGIDICELMKPVNAKKCPSLKGKPKLFFIQACQGEKTQRKEGFDHGEFDAKPVPFICHEADFFLGLATVPGYVARRDQDGAPYVHHLAKLLKDFGPTHDLSAIMAMVCDKMNDIHDDKFGWISSNHSTLRKKVVFKAK